MTAAVEYLEAAKVEEIAESLRSQGFQVDVPKANGTAPFDLVAHKGDKHVAVEVRERTALRGTAQEIRDLRRLAHNDGYTEFRLVVVTPPHEAQVDIPGLSRVLQEALRKHVPPVLGALAARMSVDSVDMLEIDAVRITQEAIDVAGNGVVNIVRRDRSSQSLDESTVETDFPFKFHVLLDRDVSLREIYELTVDTSSYDE